jgi:hypothetical protein
LFTGLLLARGVSRRTEFQGIIVRVTGNPNGYINAVYSTIARLDPDVPLFDVSSMDDRVTQSTAAARFETQLLT